MSETAPSIDNNPINEQQFEGYASPLPRSEAGESRKGQYIYGIDNEGKKTRVSQEQFEAAAAKITAEDKAATEEAQTPFERSGLTYKEYLEHGGEYQQLYREKTESAPEESADKKTSGKLKSSVELAMERAERGDMTMAQEAKNPAESIEPTDESTETPAAAVAPAAEADTDEDYISREEFQRKNQALLRDLGAVSDSSEQAPDSSAEPVSDETQNSGESSVAAGLSRVERAKLGPLIALQNAWANSRLKERLDSINEDDLEGKNHERRKVIVGLGVGAAAVVAATRGFDVVDFFGSSGGTELAGATDVAGEAALHASSSGEETARDITNGAGAFEAPDSVPPVEAGAGGFEQEATEGYTYEVQRGDGVWHSVEAALQEHGIQHPSDQQVSVAVQEVLPDLRNNGELMPGSEDWIAYENGGNSIEYTPEQMERMLGAINN